MPQSAAPCNARYFGGLSTVAVAGGWWCSIVVSLSAPLPAKM